MNCVRGYTVERHGDLQWRIVEQAVRRKADCGASGWDEKDPTTEAAYAAAHAVVRTVHDSRPLDPPPTPPAWQKAWNA